MSGLSMLVIYDHPGDYPNSVVVRWWYLDRPPIPTPADGGRLHARPQPRPGGVFSVVDTLAEARAAIPEGLVNVGRDPDDDQKIVEVWV